MIKIKKTGSTEYGNWATFEFITDLMVVNGVASHDLKLEDNKIYTNLLLIVNLINNKIKYEIVEKQK